MKEVLAKAESKMGKTIARLESDYAAIRAGRANPAVLDKVMVDYYGAPTPVNQLAAVSVAEARVLTIQPWDGSVCRAIERAIQTSDIGINPQSDVHAPRRRPGGQTHFKEHERQPRFRRACDRDGHGFDRVYDERQNRGGRPEDRVFQTEQRGFADLDA